MGDFLFNWLPFLVGVAACPFGFYLLWLGFRGFSRAAILRKAGERTTGIVTAKVIRTRTDWHRSVGFSGRMGAGGRAQSEFYEMSYAFSVGARDYEGTEDAPSDLWRASEEGSEVEVIYFPRDPSINRLAAWSDWIGLSAGATQLVVGVILGGATLGWLVTGTMGALQGPPRAEAGADWVPMTAVVSRAVPSEDPFIRLFAPGAVELGVDIGGDKPGVPYAYRELAVYPDEVPGGEIALDQQLPALMDPTDENRAVLVLETRR